MKIVNSIASIVIILTAIISFIVFIIKHFERNWEEFIVFIDRIRLYYYHIKFDKLKIKRKEKIIIVKRGYETHIELSLGDWCYSKHNPSIESNKKLLNKNLDLKIGENLIKEEDLYIFKKKKYKHIWDNELIITKK